MGGGKAKGKKFQNKEHSQQCFMNSLFTNLPILSVLKRDERGVGYTGVSIFKLYS